MKEIDKKDAAEIGGGAMLPEEPWMQPPYNPRPFDGPTFPDQDDDPRCIPPTYPDQNNLV